MRYRELDANGDYVIGFQSGNMLTGADAVEQAILTRLRLWMGEWWEDLSEGLPMTQKILGYRETKQIVDNIFRQRILATTGVSTIDSFISHWDNENRVYTIDEVRVTTIYGKAYVSEVVF